MTEVQAVKTKWCTGCEQELPLSAFPKCSGCKMGVYSRCSDCKAESQARSRRKRLLERGDEMRAIDRRNYERRAAQPKIDPGPTKVCTKCEIAQPVSEFDSHPANKDGLHSNCKSCRGVTNRAGYQRWKDETPIDEQRAGWREDRAQRPEAALAATKASYWRKHDYYLEKNAEYRDENPEVRAAHAAVERAVKRGLLPRQTDNRCVAPDCESAAHVYHHWSYEPENWLSVLPLCTSCHQLLHSGSVYIEDQQSLAIAPGASK